MDNMKRYNLFVFLGTFTRSLIETFVPIILYNRGLSIQSIFFFLLLNYTFSFVLNVPILYLSQKLTFKWLIVISSISVAISYYYLFLVPLTLIVLVIIALTHVINTHTYWLSRHYFAMEILSGEKMGTQVGNIVIFSQIAIIPSAYIGALLIKNFRPEYIIVIVLVLYIIAVIPLFKIRRESREKTYIPIGVRNILKDIPRRSVLFYILAQFRTVSKYLFPLYIYLYIKSNYEYIGIFNVAVGIASIVFVYLFARKMDKEKKDYLLLSGVLSFVVWVLKLNVISTLFMLVVGLMEGLVEKMYEMAFNRNLYALGKHYNSLAYAGFVEGLQNFFRVIIMVIIYLFIKDLRTALYLCAIMLIVTGLVGFDDGEGGY